MKRLRRQSVYSFVWSIIAVLALAAPAGAALQNKIENDAVAGLRGQLRAGTKVSLKSIPLGDRFADLELEAFDVYAADAVIDVYSEEGRTQVKPPAHRYFRGRVAGDDESMVVISVRETGEVVGNVFAHDRKFSIRTERYRPGNGKGLTRDDIVVSEYSIVDELDPEQTFTCEVEKRPIAIHQSPSKATTNGVLQPVKNGVMTSNGTRHLRLAVDTDYELYVKRGNSTSSVNTYVADMIAAANTIYARELNTELVLVYSSVFSAVGDPFNIVPEGDGNPSTNDALYELGSRWSASPPFAGTRAAVMLVSGKTFADAPGSLAGVAWVDTICEPDFAFPSANVPAGVGGRYGMFNGASSTSTSEAIPNPNANGPSYQVSTSAFDNTFWPLMAFVHELGHVVGSDHTHCVQFDPVQYPGFTRTQNYIDECYAGEGGCFSGTQSVPTEKGTIMSYCHLRAGRGTDTRYIFGKATEPTEIISSIIRSRVDLRVPVVTAINAPLSVTIGTPAIASTSAVAQNGSAISSYQWLISNGTINGSSTSASVNFTATANPVTLKVIVVSSLGCGATDLLSIPATSGTGTYVKGDFNSDTKPDVVLRNYTTGQNALWIMNGTSLTNIVDLPALPNTSYRIEGTADFNADSKNDVVLRNYATGQNALWVMNGTSLSSIVDLPALPNTAFHIEGTADFTADGKQDIILRNYSTGQNALWVMNGTALSSIVDLPALPNTNYKIESAADFTGDGKPDIVLRNYSTGQNALWIMNGTSLTTIVDLPALPNTNYRIEALADFNSDTKIDIVLRNYSTGQNALWIMNGTSLTAIVDLPALPNTAYEINGPR
ncbi:MAG TPA: FG-GAP-like repeat-containing protein [Thermoanaerobaculia bacterium]